jgi:hypothetical protein
MNVFKSACIPLLALLSTSQVTQATLRSVTLRDLEETSDDSDVAMRAQSILTGLFTENRDPPHIAYALHRAGVTCTAVRANVAKMTCSALVRLYQPLDSSLKEVEWRIEIKFDQSRVTDAVAYRSSESFPFMKVWTMH